jgi:hypothetical protein
MIFIRNTSKFWWEKVKNYFFCIYFLISTTWWWKSVNLWICEYFFALFKKNFSLMTELYLRFLQTIFFNIFQYSQTPQKCHFFSHFSQRMNFKMILQILLTVCIYGNSMCFTGFRHIFKIFTNAQKMSLFSPF